MESFIAAIPAAAANPLAFVAYLAAVIAWVVLGYRTRRTNILLKNLEKFPKKDRRPVLEKEMGTVIPKEIRPDDWLKARRQTYMFVAFIVLLFTILAVLAIAFFEVPTESSSRLIDVFVRLINDSV